MTQTDSSRIEAAANRLKQHGQDHLLRFADQLTPEDLKILLDEIESLDLPLIDELIETYIRNKTEIAVPDEIIPAPVYPIKPTDDLKEKYEQALELGKKLISENKVAVFTVAGGMGTRLKFNGPKGNVPATPIRNKMLFQVFAEGILANQRSYNCTIPWYVMTSRANHEATVDSFKRNNYFGLNPKDVMFFQQGMMPCFDHSGKILLAGPHQLAMSPDGHGGSLRALKNSGALQDMIDRGIEQISYFQIDNPLVYVVDPIFVGLHAIDQGEMSSRAVEKCEPLEKVGNFVLSHGKVNVIEYSDLDDELAHQKNDDGTLAFEWGSIAIHMISRSFIERINSHGFSLPWHVANKSVPYVNTQGVLISPDKPNAIKLETFVFDALPMADHSITLEIIRDEQFAPIKNATGVDSLESSQDLQIARAASWLQAAGIDVPCKENGQPDLILEISPLFANTPEELAAKKDKVPTLKPGESYYLG